MKKKRFVLIEFCFLLLIMFMISCSNINPASPSEPLEPSSTPPVPTSMPPTATNEPTITESENTPVVENNEPAPRRYHSFAYNSISQQVIMVGGQSEFIGDLGMLGHDNTWTYDPLSNTWSWMKPGLEPPKVFGSQLAYDAESDRVIFFGGGNGRGLNANGIAETWAYDQKNNAWMRMSDGPEKLFGTRIVYDSESDKIILFGGSDWKFTSESSYAEENLSSNETWVYDFNSDTWMNMQPEIAPPGRWYQPMAYNTKADRVVMWGGTNHKGNAADDGTVWTYDVNSNTWEGLKPAAGPNPDPDREGAAMVYNSQSDKLILYGGDAFGSETWSYDLNTNIWTLMDSGSGPSGQINLSFFAMEYCPNIDRVLLSGGYLCDKSCTYLKGTWLYDLEANQWENISP